jgi:hypothetical protein
LTIFNSLAVDDDANDEDDDENDDAEAGSRGEQGSFGPENRSTNEKTIYSTIQNSSLF